MARTLRTVLTIDASRFKAGLNNARAGMRQFNRSIVRPLGSMIKSFTRVAAVAAIAGAAISKFGLDAAGSIQSAKLRLAGISSGVDDFRKSWQTAYDTFIGSPLELGETIGAFTTLKNAGVGTKNVLEAIAGASVATNRKVEDLALSFLSLETEPLRRLGITARSVNKGMQSDFTMIAVDKMGKQVRRFANNIHDARQNLSELLNIKYGGVLDAFSRTWIGVLSTFRGVRQMVIFTVLKSTLESLSPVIMVLNQRLKTLSKSGDLQKLGEKIAKFAMDSAMHLYNLAKALKDFSMKEFLVENLGPLVAFGTIFTMIMGVKLISAVVAAKAAIMTLPVALKTALGAMLALIVGWEVGKWFERKFDISNYVLRMVEGIKFVGRSIPALLTANAAKIEANIRKYNLAIRQLQKQHEATMADRDKEPPDWMKDTLEKFKPISEEELAAMVNAGSSVGDQIKDAFSEGVKKWRNIFDERARRGIGKVFGGGGAALGGGDEQKRTKAALDMVKKQGKTNELLQRVVGGVINNERIGALAF